MNSIYDIFRAQLPDGITSNVVRREDKIWHVVVGDVGLAYSVRIQLPVVVEVGNPHLAVTRTICEAMSGIEMLRGNLDQAKAWHDNMVAMMK